MPFRTFLRLAPLLLLTLSACAHGAPAPATPLALVSSIPASGCQEVGVVRGEGGGVFGAWQRNATIEAEAREDAATKARRLGATHLVSGPIAWRERGGTTTRASVTGEAYRCEVAAEAPTTIDEPSAGGSVGGGGEALAASPGPDSVRPPVDAAPHGPSVLPGDSLGVR